jgi:RimK family alpha-L-glutamate ligase
MSTFAVVAHRATPTTTRLGVMLTPAQAVSRLRPGDIALGRLDVLQSLHGIEAGLWALELLEQRRVTVLNGQRALTIAHDKLATADALLRAGVPHPLTAHVASWLPVPALEPPVVLKPRFGSWGRDVFRCDTAEALDSVLDSVRFRVWLNATGGVLQRLVEPRGYDLRIVVAGGRVVGAALRRARAGEWRTNVALGARRSPVIPPREACELALAASAAVGTDLAGVDLLPVAGGWTVLEVNGAVDFSNAYALDGDVFSAVRQALVLREGLPAAASF